MNSTESTGRTVEEAIEKGLQELGIKRDNAQIKVISEPSQGFLGLIGSKTARVMITARFDAAAYLQNFMEKLLQIMGLRGQIMVVATDEQFEVAVSGSQSGLLIGRRGRTLNELQYLLNTVLRRQFGEAAKRVIVDVESYRSRRERTLIGLAARTARKVASTGREVTLEAMTPQERRIIHLALQGHGTVITRSQGDEPYRRVIVAPR